VLIGIATELRAGAVLTTQVSSHARRVVREIDIARRILHEARETRSLAKGISDALMTVHDKRPFPDTPAEIDEIARAVRDPSFRVQISTDGLHVYNRDGHRHGTDPFALFPQLGLEHDGSHAFYMGVELARAEIAWSLGKRYAQDSPLAWGCATGNAMQPATSTCAPDLPAAPSASASTEDSR
jgi:dihydropteroate synthase